MIREQIGHSYEISTTKFVFNSDSTRPQEEARITMQFTPTQSAARGWLLTVPADTTEVRACVYVHMSETGAIYYVLLYILYTVSPNPSPSNA